ncbi:MAG TPA: carboxypeptidase-like regulatory domain-containing protein [Gemmatimonadaceae bacterium]
MLDTAEGRMGGPCAFAKCLGDAWKHKSKMDTATVLAFARFSRKRPGIRSFGYPIPIVFISYDDVRRMDADGREVVASHPMPPDLPQRSWGFWTELQRKYPGAWGVTILSKVGFNKRHTEALVQAHQWCSDDCRVHETLFLRQTKGRWRVVERIPEQVDAGFSPYGRYLGPIGTTPKESEIVGVDRPGVPLEATARADVYRIVVDSLYSVNAERPRRIVLTNWFWSSGQIPAHSSAIDPAIGKKFSVLGAIRAPFDAISKYRVAISTLPVDSIPALRERGASLDVDQTGYPFWVAFANKYSGAWGMLGVSRIAFNANRSQALVSTYHACGNSCVNRDTWFLTRSGKSWQIAERIPGEKQSNVEVEPLRYLGLDVSPIAYRQRRVQGVVTDEVTGKPLPFLDIIIRRALNSGVNVTDAPVRTDTAGHYTLTKLPLNAAMTMVVPCPGQQHAAQVQPIGVMPGMDTTINISVNLGICDTTAVKTPPAAPNPLSGAQAFISSDSARFEFPRQPTATYEWDVPTKGAYAGDPEYMWGVEWETADSLAGEAPYLLWLIKRWKAGGPRRGSLKQLISAVPLQPMVGCTTCDGAVFEDPKTDHSKVFATIENGRLVFVVRGAEAVRRIFPTVPTIVAFTQTVRHDPLPQYGPGDVSSSQHVLVNCRNSDESADAKHRCDVKH